NDKGVVTICRDVPSNLSVAGDESKLKRAIMNLVNNAMDVLIDRKTPDPCITISTEMDQAGKQLLIAIRDNGPGIPDEIMKTLFDPFVTKQKSNGTGLGLTIVKQYITAHGGEINVANDKVAVF